jgi:hypothetical protein
MKMKKVALLFAFVSVPVFAGGNGVGNGGKGVVCRSANGQVSSVRLLDYYEADVRGIKIDLGSPELSVDDKLELAIGRLKQTDSVRATRYTARVADFFNPANTKFLKGTVLESTNDSYEDSFPAGCTVENLVVRKQPEFPEDRLWTVSQDLWDAVKNDDKAGLVLHEVIYDDVLTQTAPQQNSINARYYNSYLSADKLTTMAIQPYVQFMQQLQFGTATIYGVAADLRAAVLFYDSGKPKYFTVADGASYQLGDTRIPLEGVITFYEDGTPENLGVRGATVLHSNGQTLQVDGVVDFYPAGNIASAQSVLAVSDVIVAGHTVHATGEIDFFPNGKLKYLSLFGANLIPVYGALLEAKDVVEFDENGKIPYLTLTHPQSYSWLGQSHLIMNSSSYPSKVDPPSGQVFFYSNGVPQYFDAADETIQFQLQSGGPLVHSEPSETLTLYPSGKLQELLTFNTYGTVHLESSEFSIDTADAKFFEDGYLSSAQGSGTVTVNGKQLTLAGTDASVSFHPNHALKQVYSFSNSITLAPQGIDIDFCDSISFYDDHSMSSGSLCKPGWFSSKTVDVRVQGQKIAFLKPTDKQPTPGLEFYPGGKLKSGFIAQDASFKDFRGNSAKIAQDQRVYFDQKGQLATWENRASDCNGSTDPVCQARTFSCAMKDESGQSYQVNISGTDPQVSGNMGSIQIFKGTTVFLDFKDQAQVQDAPMFPYQPFACVIRPDGTPIWPNIQMSIDLDLATQGVYPATGSIVMTEFDGPVIKLVGSCSSK